MDVPRTCRVLSEVASESRARPRVRTSPPVSGPGEGGSTSTPPNAADDDSAEGKAAIDSARWGTVGTENWSVVDVSD